MRKVDRLKKLHAPIDDKYKKIDTTVNGDAERLAEMHRETEKGKYPLRIDHRTVIYVTKDKCTPEYAAKKRNTLGLAPAVEVKGHASRLVDMDKLFDAALAVPEISGIILNPWNRTIQLDKTLIRIIKGA